MGASDFGWSSLILEMLDPDARARDSFLGAVLSWSGQDLWSVWRAITAAAMTPQAATATPACPRPSPCSRCAEGLSVCCSLPRWWSW